MLNTTLKDMKDVKATFSVFDINGKKLFQYQQMLKKINANSLTECFTLLLPTKLPKVYLVRLILYDVTNKIISLNEYWKSLSDNFMLFNQLKKVNIKANLLNKNNKIEIELTNYSSVPAIGLKPALRNTITNERILPAIFSDAYFTLLPHERKKLSVNFKTTEPTYFIVEGYNLVNCNKLIIK